MILPLFFDAGVALLYAFCCTCAGSVVFALPGLGRGRAAPRPAGAHLTVAFILGQGVVSQALILLGLVVDFTPWVVASTLALAVLLGIRSMLPSLRESVSAAVAALRRWRGEAIVWRIAAIAAVLYAGGLLLGALLLPPSGDAEAFYFVYPKFIAAGRRLAPLSGNYEPFSSIGLVGELHFAALMLLVGQSAAKAFAWFIAAAACAMLMYIARACGLGVRGSLAALLLMLTSSTFTAYVTDGKVDLFAAALGLAAYFWALQTRVDANDDVPAALAGLLAGLACVAKISYIPTLVPGILLLLALREPSPVRMPSLARRFTSFGIAAAIAVLPHVAKNAVFFGEPLAPFFSGTGGSMVNQVWFSAETTRWILMTYPLALVFGQYPMQGGTLSFLALAIFPLAVFLPRPARWRDSTLAQVTLAGLVGIAIWLVLRPSVLAPRYLLAPILLLLLLPSRALEYASLMKPGPRVLNLALAAAFAATLFVSAGPIMKLVKDAAISAPLPIPACYGASPYCEALQQVNQRTPPGGRIFLGMYYTYWLRPDLLICRNTDAEIELEKALPDGASRWAELFARGFETVVLDKSSHKKELVRLDPAAAPAWLDVRGVAAVEPLVVYSIESRDAARKASFSCRPREPAGWRVVPVLE